MINDPTPPGSAVDADEIRRERELAEARGIIREVHAFCATKCPHRERCPGMACKQYQREMAARDVIAREVAPSPDVPVGPGGIIMEPTIQ